MEYIKAFSAEVQDETWHKALAFCNWLKVDQVDYFNSFVDGWCTGMLTEFKHLSNYHSLEFLRENLSDFVSNHELNHNSDFAMRYREFIGNVVIRATMTKNESWLPVPSYLQYLTYVSDEGSVPDVLEALIPTSYHFSPESMPDILDLYWPIFGLDTWHFHLLRERVSADIFKIRYPKVVHRFMAVVSTRIGRCSLRQTFELTLFARSLLAINMELGNALVLLPDFTDRMKVIEGSHSNSSIRIRSWITEAMCRNMLSRNISLDCFPDWSDLLRIDKFLLCLNSDGCIEDEVQQELFRETEDEEELQDLDQIFKHADRLTVMSSFFEDSKKEFSDLFDLCAIWLDHADEEQIKNLSLMDVWNEDDAEFSSRALRQGHSYGLNLDDLLQD